VTEDLLFPVGLSLRVALLAMLIAGPLGLGLAWLQQRVHYPGRGWVDALIMLPLVLPPSVVGYVLVLGFGRSGPLGPTLEALLGGPVIFTSTAAVLAAAIVALPLMVKATEPALAAVPRDQEEVARTLGLSPWRVFWRVTLPHARRGVAAGLVLAFARALGEFGATLMFAGNIPGQTNTMPLELYAAYQSGADERALFYVIVMIALSMGVVFVSGRLATREGGS
jgi:molybdate transport system permease protein